MPTAAMSAAAPALAPDVPAATIAQVRSHCQFLGDARVMRRMLVRGSGLLLVTFGLYGLWLSTDIRRYVWANTEIAGDGLEYLGTPRQRLMEAAAALFFFLPLAVVGWPHLGLTRSFAAMLALVLVLSRPFVAFTRRGAWLGQTLFRGLRCQQTGSACYYGGLALLWWCAVLLTAGLAYPWAQASLVRYKMSHTYYGDLRGRFDGLASELFFRGFPAWLLTVPPLLFALAVAIEAAVEVNFLAVVEDAGANVPTQIAAANPDSAAPLIYPALALLWSATAAALLYPAFLGVRLRWWLSGLRFGDLAVGSRLGTKRLYGMYLLCLARVGLLALAVMVTLLLLTALLRLLDPGLANNSLPATAGTAAGLALYVLIIIVFLLYQLTVKWPLWRLVIQSLEICGLHVLERVHAKDAATSPPDEAIGGVLHIGSY